MKYVLNSAMSKEVDRYTIEEVGMPSLVLMERAALAVATKCAQAAEKFGREVRICAVCGCGNNGADGVAAARILTWQGMPVDIIVVGNEENATADFGRQIEIAANSGLVFRNSGAIEEYDIIIDAIFGVGLSRAVEGEYGKVIEQINGANNLVISVDLPSGIDAGNGQVHGCAVKAAATVTFGYNKQGLMLFPGKEFAGEVTVADIGFSPEAIRHINPAMYFTMDDLRGIPERIADANKGTYGRVLIIAGSEDMSGAAYLSAKAAYKSGVGLVEILTHESNLVPLRSLLPEAIIVGYDSKNVEDRLETALRRADAVVLGPGLSMNGTAAYLVTNTIDKVSVPIIIDADALNILAKDISLLDKCGGTVIITPHIGEMSRLYGLDATLIKADALTIAGGFAGEHNCICVLKDAVSVAAEPEPKCRRYINNSGCAALAKGGSGDVLTGIIAGMLSLKLEPFSAAAMGVYIHGLAGEAAADEKGMHGVLASDIIDKISNIMR